MGRQPAPMPYLLAPLVAPAGTAGRRPRGLFLSISPALTRGSGLPHRNVDLSAPENPDRARGAWPVGWRRGPTSPGRTLATGMRPGRGGPGGGSRPRASHAAFPRVKALASPQPDRGPGGGEAARSFSGRGKLGTFPSVCTALRQEAAAPESPTRAKMGPYELALRCSESLGPLSSDLREQPSTAPVTTGLPRILAPVL